MVVWAVRYEPVSLLLCQYQGHFGKKHRGGSQKCQKDLRYRRFWNISPIRYQGGTGSLFLTATASELIR
jgi:hypothetical protein